MNLPPHKDQNPVVRIRNLTRRYPSAAVPVPAIADVSMDIHRGEFLALCGPSGSGKTTLLNLMGGLDMPSSGSVQIEGFALEQMSMADLARMRRDRIGFVFQSHNLIPVLTAYENAEFTLALQKRPRAERRRLAMSALEHVGLGELAHRYPYELSGGQQQRVAIARAIAPGPALVLADEPTASLDSASAATLLDLMQRLNRDDHVTFVFSTHDPRVMERARRTVNILDGRLTG